MLQGVPSLRVDFAQTMGALQSRQTASKGFRSALSDMAGEYATGVTRGRRDVQPLACSPPRSTWTK
jgi:hypothetical protein